MMNDRERTALAEQLLENPLFELLLDEQEQNAVERMVSAPDDKTRLDGAVRVQAIRSLRSDCLQAVSSKRERKAAPA